MFPDGPSYVDVAIASEKLTILIQERTLYGYTVDQVTGKIEYLFVIFLTKKFVHIAYNYVFLLKN